MNTSMCYFPDGTTMGHVPCDPEAANSACCSTGESCLGSGLCYSDNGGIYRGACTDKHWEAEECARVCLKDDGSWDSGSQSGVSFLIQCGNTDVDQPQWACADEYAHANCTSAPMLRVGPILHVNITGTATSASPTSGFTTVTVTATVKSTKVGTDNVVALGTSISLGCLLIVAVAAAVWYGRRWAAIKRDRTQYTPGALVHPQSEEFSPNKGNVMVTAYQPEAHYELSGEVQFVELGDRRQ